MFDVHEVAKATPRASRLMEGPTASLPEVHHRTVLHGDQTAAVEAVRHELRGLMRTFNVWFGWWKPADWKEKRVCKIGLTSLVKNFKGFL